MINGGGVVEKSSVASCERKFLETVKEVIINSSPPSNTVEVSLYIDSCVIWEGIVWDNLGSSGGGSSDRYCYRQTR